MAHLKIKFQRCVLISTLNSFVTAHYSSQNPCIKLNNYDLSVDRSNQENILYQRENTSDVCTSNAGRVLVTDNYAIFIQSHLRFVPLKLSTILAY